MTPTSGGNKAVAASPKEAKAAASPSKMKIVLAADPLAPPKQMPKRSKAKGKKYQAAEANKDDGEEKEEKKGGGGGGGGEGRKEADEGAPAAPVAKSKRSGYSDIDPSLIIATPRRPAAASSEPAAVSKKTRAGGKKVSKASPAPSDDDTPSGIGLTAPPPPRRTGRDTRASTTPVRPSPATEAGSKSVQRPEASRSRAAVDGGAPRTSRALSLVPDEAKSRAVAQPKNITDITPPSSPLLSSSSQPSQPPPLSSGVDTQPLPAGVFSSAASALHMPMPPPYHYSPADDPASLTPASSFDGSPGSLAASQRSDTYVRSSFLERLMQ